MPCPKHKRLPDVSVCSSCLGEMGEFSRTAQETLQVMPKVFQELHEEGMSYFVALERAYGLLGGNSEDPPGDQDLIDARLGIAAVLEDFESRILHRPATGKAKQLAEQALQK